MDNNIDEVTRRISAEVALDIVVEQRNNLKIINDSLLEALKDAQKYITYLINNTPSGEKRNVFTDANIRALAAIQKAEQ